MKKKVITIGSATHDIFIDFADPYMLYLHLKDRNQSFIALEEGTKINVDHVNSFVGGGAANAATSFKRLGFETEAFFKIGTDSSSDFIMNRMAQENVKLDHVIRADNEQTGISFIIPCPSGDRAVLTYRGANLMLAEQEIPLSAIAACDQIYVTSLSFNLAKLLPFIASYAKEKNKLVAVNPGSSQARNGAPDLIKALPFIDVLILNSYESNLLMLSLQDSYDQQIKSSNEPQKKASELPKLLQSPINFQQSCFSLPLYFRAILSKGPKIVVVTNGAEGVYAASGDTIYFYPSPQIKVVSTVGAGDSFGSAFVASLLNGKEIDQALITGTMNSSSVISHIGTQTGLLTLEELEARMKKADHTLLQRFKL